MTKSSHLLICCQCCQSLQRPPPSVGGPCGERAHDEEGQHDGGLPATRRQCQLFLDDHHQPSGQQAGHGLCPGWDTQSGKRLVMTCQWRASLTHLIYLSWTWAFVPPPNTCFFSDSCWLIDFCCFGRETDPGAPLDSTNHNAHLAYPYTFLKLHTKKKTSIEISKSTLETVTWCQTTCYTQTKVFICAIGVKEKPESGVQATNLLKRCIC